MHKLQQHPRLQQVGQIFSIAWPMLIGQLAVVSNGVIDTAMTSRFSATDLAALSIGISIYVTVFVGLNGVLQSISPVIGQLYGAASYRQIGATVKQAIWLALLLSICGCAILLHPAALLDIANASPELHQKSSLYLQILATALPASLGFRIYSGLNNALGLSKMVMAIQIGSLLLKFPLNHLFIFGGFGIPAMGGPGCAVATSLISWCMLLAGWLILRHAPRYRPFHLFGDGLVWPQRAAMLRLLKLGIPMGCSYLIEVTAYTFMALFIARLGTLAVAGHQIAANFGAVLYMLPLSIANASCTLVARQAGAGQWQQASQLTRTAFWLTFSLTLPAGLLIWFLKPLILRGYTPDAAIIAAALPLFVFIAVYQMFDALQVVAAFILRAYHIAVVPTVLYAVALWGFGLGGGYLIGLDPLQISPAALSGAKGFWFANTVSIALAAVSLWIYLLYTERQFSKRQPAE